MKRMVLSTLNLRYLDIVDKSDFHVAGNFAGIHTEWKHVIMGSSHLPRELFPLTPDTDV